MKRAKLQNFIITLNGAIVYVAGIALSYDRAHEAYNEVDRRRELSRKGLLDEGHYAVMAS